METILRNRDLVSRDDASADLEDRGYQFGDGIYEVIRVYDGEPFLLDEHMDRFERSAREISLKMPCERAELLGRMRGLIAANEIATGTIYVQMTRGVHPRSQMFPPDSVPAEVTAFARPLDRPGAEQRNGVSAILTADMRWLRCDIKSLNLLPNVLARQTARKAGCYEAIQHRGEAVTEGAFSNVFIVAEGVVLTTPASNLILSGITRAKLLELCEACGWPVVERTVACQELLGAEEVFITSTVNEVMPVVRVNDQTIGNGEPGPVTRNLQKAFDRAIDGAADV